MKTYIRILGITLSIEAAGIFLSRFVEDVLLQQYKSSILPFLIMFGSFILALLTGIILALKKCKTRKAKLVAIFLMPTNYVLPVIILLLIMMCMGMLSILTNLSPIFG